MNIHSFRIVTFINKVSLKKNVFEPIHWCALSKSYYVIKMTSFTFWGDGDLEPDKDPMSTPDDDSHEFEFQSSSHESGELILSDLKK